VVIVTSLLVGQSRVRLPARTSDFPLPKFHTGSGACPGSLSTDTASFPREKQLELEVDKSPPYSAEDKNEDNDTITPPPCAFMSWAETTIPFHVL